MLKKIMVTVVAAGMLLGNVQAKSLRDLLGAKLDPKYREVTKGDTSLDLAHKGITEITLEEGTALAHNYPKLKSLNLSENKLTSLPKTIGQLHKLEELSLDLNKLTSLPKTIGQLTSLKWLSLRSNKLTSLPKTIGQLKNLIKLDLSNNQLKTLPAGVFSGLTNLKQLGLSNNQLNDQAINVLVKMTWLKFLSVSGNRLKIRQGLRLRKAHGLKVQVRAI